MRNSFEAFAASPRPMLNVPSAPSSLNPGLCVRLLLYSDALVRLKSNSRRRNDRRCVEVCRTNVDGLMAYDEASGMGRRSGSLKGPLGINVAQRDLLSGTQEEEDLRDVPGAKVAWHRTPGLACTHADGPDSKPDCRRK